MSAIELSRSNHLLSPDTLDTLLPGRQPAADQHAARLSSVNRVRQSCWYNGLDLLPRYNSQSSSILLLLERQVTPSDFDRPRISFGARTTYSDPVQPRTYSFGYYRIRN